MANLTAMAALLGESFGIDPARANEIGYGSTGPLGTQGSQNGLSPKGRAALEAVIAKETMVSGGWFNSNIQDAAAVAQVAVNRAKAMVASGQAPDINTAIEGLATSSGLNSSSAMGWKGGYGPASAASHRNIAAPAGSANAAALSQVMEAVDAAISGTNPNAVTDLMGVAPDSPQAGVNGFMSGGKHSGTPLGNFGGGAHQYTSFPGWASRMQAYEAATAPSQSLAFMSATPQAKPSTEVAAPAPAPGFETPGPTALGGQLGQLAGQSSTEPARTFDSQFGQFDVHPNDSILAGTSETAAPPGGYVYGVDTAASAVHDAAAAERERQMALAAAPDYSQAAQSYDPSLDLGPGWNPPDMQTGMTQQPAETRSAPQQAPAPRQAYDPSTPSVGVSFGTGPNIIGSSVGVASPTDITAPGPTDADRAPMGTGERLAHELAAKREAAIAEAQRAQEAQLASGYPSSAPMANPLAAPDATPVSTQKISAPTAPAPAPAPAQVEQNFGTPAAGLTNNVSQLDQATRNAAAVTGALNAASAAPALSDRAYTTQVVDAIDQARMAASPQVPGAFAPTPTARTFDPSTAVQVAGVTPQQVAEEAANTPNPVEETQAPSTAPATQAPSTAPATQAPSTAPATAAPNSPAAAGQVNPGQTTGASYGGFGSQVGGGGIFGGYAGANATTGWGPAGSFGLAPGDYAGTTEHVATAMTGPGLFGALGQAVGTPSTSSFFGGLQDAVSGLFGGGTTSGAAGADGGTSGGAGSSGGYGGNGGPAGGGYGPDNDAGPDGYY